METQFLLEKREHDEMDGACTIKVGALPALLTDTGSVAVRGEYLFTQKAPG